MRILLVGNYEPDRQQSMTRYAQWLLRALRARGLTVVLIRPVPWFSRLAVGPLRRPAIVKYLGYLDKYLIFPSQLRKAAPSFDLVHVLDHSNSMYLGAAAGVASVITCHDLLAVRAARGEFKATRTGSMGRRLQAWILKGLTRAEHIVSVSEKTAQDLARLAGRASGDADTDADTDADPDADTVILNPLNWNYKPQPGFPAALRERLGLKPDEPYFFHIGGNQWYKNRLGVVRIFRELAGASPFQTAKLVMAGKPFPPDLQALVRESGLADRVVSAVDVSNEDLQALYSHAIALLFPSLEEGFGWPIAEAQACGCVVVTTNRPPMSEVAGSAAILIDPEDPKAAAAAICSRLADHPAEPDALREAGFRNVARFDPEVIAAQYCAFYRRVAGREKNSDAVG